MLGPNYFGVHRLNGEQSTRRDGTWSNASSPRCWEQGETWREIIRFGVWHNESQKKNRQDIVDGESMIICGTQNLWCLNGLNHKWLLPQASLDLSPLPRLFLLPVPGVWVIIESAITSNNDSISQRVMVGWDMSIIAWSIFGSYSKNNLLLAIVGFHLQQNNYKT